MLDDDVYRLYISIRSRDIRGQSRKLSLNALNFRRLLPPPQKLYQRYHPYLAAHHVANFHEATRFSSKVLAPNALHFKPILTPHPLLEKL